MLFFNDTLFDLCKLFNLISISWASYVFGSVF